MQVAEEFRKGEGKGDREDDGCSIIVVIPFLFYFIRGIGYYALIENAVSGVRSLDWSCCLGNGDDVLVAGHVEVVAVGI